MYAGPRYEREYSALDLMTGKGDRLWWKRGIEQVYILSNHMQEAQQRKYFKKCKKCSGSIVCPHSDPDGLRGYHLIPCVSSPLFLTIPSLPSLCSTVRIWDYTQDACINVLSGHTAPVRGLLWNTEVPYLLTSGTHSPNNNPVRDY